MSKHPEPQQVRDLRTRLQRSRNLGVMEAQQVCAEAACASLSAWRKWERGERRMHPAFWWCAQKRAGDL